MDVMCTPDLTKEDCIKCLSKGSKEILLLANHFLVDGLYLPIVLYGIGIQVFSSLLLYMILNCG
ncbi:hypothetical protein HanXRQr2_Chr05g0194031 [Helianthus annuus]|uniref:Uncharacterized protein n=1 Tax=Helianthus annuus TaxID=4232 RepID=A0A9K3IWC5_HELAN|nr:hypothetical protein HanXRQr2_Chr05g0194031 [Helianthus annuus]